MNFKNISITLYCVIAGLLLSITGNVFGQNRPNSSTLSNQSSTLPVINIPVTSQVNYVRHYKYLAQRVDTSTLSNDVNSNAVIQSTQYFDGLGRVLQNVSLRQSPSGNDLVSFMVYDEYGRQSYQPIPYAAMSSNGGMKLTPAMEQQSRLTNHFAGENVFYAYTNYESSPLNRPLVQMAPGNSWAGSGVGVESRYELNTTAEEARRWEYGALPQSNAAYTANQLYVNITIDEEGHQVREYTNARGQVILKRVQNGSSPGPGHSGWLNTYYVYNELNQLAYVLPPRLVELLETNAWQWQSNMLELAFRYTYDGRNRMTSKLVPGSGRVDMVYDALDRLVLSQDANQRASSEWSFNKYDGLGRLVISGLLESADNRQAMQSAVNGFSGLTNVDPVDIGGGPTLSGHSIELDLHSPGTSQYIAESSISFLPGFDSQSSVLTAFIDTGLAASNSVLLGYDDRSFPLLKDYDSEVLSVNYYDNHEQSGRSFSTDFNSFHASGVQNALTPMESNQTRGLATGSKVKVLGSDDHYLSTVMFYDDHSRVIQTQSDNHMGGTDASTTQYDFSGRVLHTYSVHENPESDMSETRLFKRFSYDHAGRLLSIQQRLNDTGNVKTLVAHNYNELGELETKTLGEGLESLEYDYNVRGWLKSINGDYVATGSGDHYFGMDLSYDYGFEHNLLNGNIAGIKWRSVSSPKERAYGFSYDPSNRLIEADYRQKEGSGTSWLKTESDFSTSYGYDANGNILNLLRQGTVAGTVMTIDQLTYDYGTGFGQNGSSNRLKAVRDTAGDLGQGDFVDDNTSGHDYQYDLNGNMTEDLNKGVTSIAYNHLNLPEEVSFSGGRSISYTYDAAGIKLSKLTNDNGQLTRTDYLGGFIYENDELQHFAHEEGRVRVDHNQQLVYDYFVKDHLGNTRMTLTESQEQTVYLATMESDVAPDGTDLAAFENNIFLNLDATRYGGLSMANHSQEPGIVNDETARLNGSDAARRVGPAKMLMVNAGDRIEIEAFAYHQGGYQQSVAIGQTNLALALIGGFGGSATAAIGTEARQVYELFNANAALAYIGNSGNSNAPKAYLNYILFDAEMNYVDAGYDQVSGTAHAHQLLQLARDIDQKGFIYIYVSNENQSSFNVYFDDLRITHEQGPVLQEDHYYPFGATINALSNLAPLSKSNQFKYQGKELQTDFNLNLYDFHARQYDPWFLRTTTLDPDASNYYGLSPYSWAANNPGRFLDPDGKNLLDRLRAFGQKVVNKVRSGRFETNHQKDVRVFRETVSKFNSINDQIVADGGEGMSSLDIRAFAISKVGRDPFQATLTEYKPDVFEIIENSLAPSEDDEIVVKGAKFVVNIAYGMVNDIYASQTGETLGGTDFGASVQEQGIGGLVTMIFKPLKSVKALKTQNLRQFIKGRRGIGSFRQEGKRLKQENALKRVTNAINSSALSNAKTGAKVVDRTTKLLEEIKNN